MRIKLTVQRHSLPPAYVLWTVGVPRPPYTATGASVTVSQLLEQVNDVIPLEAAEWGLEDYAVEVGGFECLHFAELIQIFKEDDEVCIRPLQTSDLRFRRVSGRHQITADGRHLIDGVAFGRPFLRRTERPAIKIPPRKRRRVMYDDPADDSNGDTHDDRQAITHAGFEDSDTVPNESEDGADEDYVTIGQEEADLSAELEDIHQDLRDQSGRNESNNLEAAVAPDNDSATTGLRRSKRSQGARQGLGLQGPELLKLTDENGRPYPSGFNNLLLELYHQEGSARPDANARKRKRRSVQGHEASHQSPKANGKGPGATRPTNRRESSTSSKSVRFEDNPLTTPPTTILDAEDSEDTEDEDFEPPADGKDETDESDKENAEPKVDEDVSSEIMSSESESSSSTSESDDDSDDTSSSGSSTSSSEAKTEVEQRPVDTSKTLAQTDDTSNSTTSSSDSSSTSEDDEASNKTTAATNGSVLGPVTAPEQPPLVLQPGQDESQELTLSTRQYNKIRKLAEPERARRWLRGILEGDSNGHVVQFHLYHAYRAQFLHDCTGGNDVLSAKTLITMIFDLFGGARAAHLTTPRDEYVVKGIRPRSHSTGSMSQSALRIPPGQGKVSTQKRNERRRNAKRIISAQKAGESSVQDTFQDSMAKVKQPTAIFETREAGSPPVSSTPDDAESEFLARRQALLESIASGGVEVDVGHRVGDPLIQKQISHTVPMDISVNAEGALSDVDARKGSTTTMLARPVEESQKIEDGTPGIVDDNNAVSLEQRPSQEASQPAKPPSEDSTESSKPRSKIDLASSRRLLFGALGLRTPKTKEDERTLQAKLMNDARPANQVQASGSAPEDHNTEQIAGDDESWRDKIDLRAVECCYEGITLSNPPFPFVQRWDPQQKRGYSNVETKRKSGRGNKRKRDNERYYDDRTEEQASMPATKRGKSISPTGNFDVAETQTMEVQGEQPPDAPPNSSDSNQGAVNEQLLRESQEAAENAQIYESYEEDLPPLPDDITAYPDLTLDTAKAGTVIAFKKLDMSVETSWQPRISDYRTAIIDECQDDGTLYMTLAFRDRPNQEATYDPETGERLYHKFEMPGYDNQEDEENEGHLELPLAELIEPKIVQAPESNQDEAALPVISGGASDHANKTSTGMTCEDEPQVDTELRPSDETWEGFEETGRLDEPEGTDHTERLEDIEELQQTTAIGQSEECRQVEAIDPVQETEHLQKSNEAVIPTMDGSDDISYPDLGDKLKELVTMPVEEVSNAAPDAVSTLPRTAEPLQSDATTISARDQLRQEISELIKDAGWRSSIHVPVEEPSPQQESQIPHQEAIEVNVQSSNPPSPRFNGFGHTSIMEDASETLPAEIPETYQEPVEVADSVPAQSVDYADGFRQESLENHITDEDLASANNHDDSLMWDAQESEQITPARASPSISPPQASRMPRSRLQPQHGAPQIRLSASPPRKTKGKPKSLPNPSENQSPILPPKVSQPRTKARNSGPQAKPSDPSPFGSDGLNSEDDLPTLEKVFASRISSLHHPSSQSSTNLTIKPEDNSQTNLSAIPTHTPSHTKASIKSSSLNSPLPILSSDDENPSPGFIFSSQIPQGSQIVDLTLSSDPVEPSDSAYEGDSSLPNGPGWITKLRSSQRARSEGKAGERRSNGGVALVGR